MFFIKDKNQKRGAKKNITREKKGRASEAHTPKKKQKTKRENFLTFCTSHTETTVEVDKRTRKNVFHRIHCKHAKLVRVVQRPILEQQNRNLLGDDDDESDVEILRQCRIGRKSKV